MDTTKTYAEAEGEKPFDWNAFLATEHTTEEWYDAYCLACKWTTCACGNQCAALPRHPITGAPLDRELRRLGFRFQDNIEYRDAMSAIETLDEIEFRTAALLKAVH